MLSSRIQKQLKPLKITILVLGLVVLFALFLWLLVESNITYEDSTVQASRTEVAETPKEDDDHGFVPLDVTPRLDIPVTSISAAIEHSGLTEEGDMAEPTTGDIVGWYKYGTYPGEGGNAVMAGHVDYPGSRTGGIFARLHELEEGDEIRYVTDEATFKYRVVSMNSYHLDNAPLRDIFGTTDYDRLTLITCSGAWNESIDTYNERLIVVAERVE